MTKIQMTKTEISKPRKFDLEDRTLIFAKKILVFANALPKLLSNSEVGRQLIRSAGSVGANYIEANESLSRKDFAVRIKICRKEAKESRYWLRLVNSENEVERLALEQEAAELMKIFGSIVEKTK